MPEQEERTFTAPITVVVSGHANCHTYTQHCHWKKSSVTAANPCKGKQSESRSDGWPPPSAAATVAVDQPPDQREQRQIIIKGRKAAPAAVAGSPVLESN